MSDKPSSGDEATTIAINNLVTAVTMTLLVQPHGAATSFLNVLDQMNAGLLGEGKMRDALAQNIQAKRNLIDQMQV